MFMTVDELRQYTRRHRKSLIIRALRDRGIAHDIADDGYPVVLRSVIEAKLGQSDSVRRRRGPNIEALRRVSNGKGKDCESPAPQARHD